VNETPTTIETLIAIFRSGQTEAFQRMASALDSADLADVLAELQDDERLEAVRILPPEISANALAALPEDVHAEETLAALDPEQAADIVEELEDDDAADLIGELEPEEQERILGRVEEEDRAEVEHLLRYDEETAGGIMTTHLVTVRKSDTANQALAKIRQQADEVEDFYQVFVVDGMERLAGILPLKALVLSAPGRPVREIMESADNTVLPDLDQEEVARVMARYDLPAVPVVDADGKLLGRVTFDDVSDVMEEEHTEDLLRFSGVAADEGLAVALKSAVRTRLPWLYLNLFTAFLAAAVVLYFKDEIQRTVLLAALMPVIAGLGGNAGTQALAVTVRRLALGLISQRQGLEAVAKEALIGATNGLAVGVAIALVTLAMGEDPRLGLLVFLAMTFNVFVAGTAGAFIPIVLEKAGIDPAIASSVFVTTLTDIVGFAFLLGLAGFLLV
jgi:magnesium transporter